MFVILEINYILIVIAGIKSSQIFLVRFWRLQCCYKATQQLEIQILLQLGLATVQADQTHHHGWRTQALPSVNFFS
jgi:hypothetical protein